MEKRTNQEIIKITNHILNQNSIYVRENRIQDVCDLLELTLKVFRTKDYHETIQKVQISFPDPLNPKGKYVLFDGNSLKQAKIFLKAYVMEEYATQDNNNKEETT